jgi:hypothetical protein
MNLDCFRRQFHTKVLSRSKELQPLTNIWGTNSPLIQHTINLAVSCMEEGEAYFEVGCLYGSSLDSANKGNDDKIKYCVDMQWQGEMSRLTGTMPNLFCKESKYEDVDLKSFLQHPIGCFYFDGGHEREQTFDALEGIIPFLSDQALVIIDDYDGYSRVYNAVREFVRKHSDQFMIIHEFWTPDQFIACTKGFDNQDWHDGMVILEFERIPEERDESIEEIAISVWHSTSPYEGRHNFVYPKELKHIHGKEEIHISEYNKQESGFVIKR